MKDSKDYLKRRKHCELTVVVHYSAEANHPQYYGFQSAYWNRYNLWINRRVYLIYGMDWWNQNCQNSLLWPWWSC